MRVPDGFIDEIKARIRPSELIGRTVALKRQGREFIGLSPFKKERTPSFFVNDDKGFYHCFATQKHGDVFSWLQETQGLSFGEAIEVLAQEAGMEVPKADPLAAQKEERRRGLIEWMELAGRFFHRKLKSDDGAEARHYLTRRGVNPDVWDEFGLGYAPDRRSALKDFLLAEGAPMKELVEAGLLIAPDDGGAPYDRFRGRVMFPIYDPRKRLVGFGGRALNKEARAKYLNSPETPIFHKGSLLYHYPEARTAVAEPTSGLKGVIVAEGYMDVIAFARAGLKQAVAPLGTAVTEDQLRLLWRAGPEPVFCLDGDSAGTKAAGLAAERALPLLEPGRSLRFVFLPDGQDPDDLLREAGPSALKAVIAGAKPLVDVLWQREFDQEELSDPDRRAGFRKRLRALTAKITDPDIKAEYKAEFDRRLDSAFGRASNPQKNFTRSWGAKKGVPEGPSAALRRARLQKNSSPDARQLILALIEWPDLAEIFLETIAELSFDGLDSLGDAILDACSSGDVADRDSLRAALIRRGYEDMLRRLELDRAPMRAAFGGEDADLDARAEAWRNRATSYMERTQSKSRDAEVRARLETMIGEGKSEQIKRMVAGLHKGRTRSGSLD